MKKLLILFLLLTPLNGWCVKPVQIVTKRLTAGQNGVAYSATFSAKFGTKPYTWTQPSGTLPTGLSLAAATGILSGTPSANGTFTFVIVVTDSAGAPTADTRNYSMVVTGAAPITPVSITTTSLPDGTNGVAYSTTLQAANGTTPYTWSIPSGALPPGVTLTAATGALAGTLTASGTYGFTARVTDAASGTYDRAFVVSVATGSPTYLFSDALSTNFAAWTEKWDSTNTTIAACPGGGSCAQMHYVICGDSSNPACGSSHQDRNLYVQKTYSTAALTEVWHRIKFYIKTPETGASSVAGRKIIYDTAGCFNCSLFPSGDPWSFFVNVTDLASDGWPGAGPMKMVYGFQGATIGGPVFNQDCGSGSNPITGAGCAVAYDTWYTLEVRVKYNTQAVAPFDGEVQIFLDGVSVLNLTAQSLNRETAYKLRTFRIGAQEDRDNYNIVDIYHYIKDVVINDSYIGP